MENYNVAIIGGGPGGYVAAIRAAKLGLSVALIEARDLGGTCLNRGCIPSKTLLKHAEVMDQIRDAKSLGITVNDFSFSMTEIVGRKNKVINQLKNGISILLKQNKIQVFNGIGSVTKDKAVIITNDKGEETIKADNIILATGSTPVVPNIPGIDQVNVHTSDTIFDITEVPEHLVIVGGGVIGVEIACVFNSFGSKVEVIEMADRIIPLEDKDASAFLQKKLKAAGITFHTNTIVTSFKQVEGKTVVEMEKGGKKLEVPTYEVLMSVGRAPNKTGLAVLSLKESGPFVEVDKNMKTSMKNIYAIGDLIGGYQLAHAASNEGLRAVNHIAGNKTAKDALIPRCVYSFPEVASIGLSEADAKTAGYKVNVQKIDLAGNGKAISSNENAGFMKLIADETYGEIIGVVMVGAHVTEMISQATAFMHLEGTVEEIEQMVFPHPTISEGLFEAAGAWLGKGIHYS